jgi:ABC-type oligopeptide transport system ATPase subunit
LTLAQKKEIYDFYIDSGRKKTQSYLATYFSETFGTQIQRQVIARIIDTPETFQ